MATFQKRGAYQWRVQVRRKGFSPQSKTFNTRPEAEAWAREIEGEMDRGSFVSRKEAENTTLNEALERYEREISSKKKGYPQEKYKIAALKKTPFSSRWISAVRSIDVAEWRDKLLETSSPSTVNRLLIILSHVFTIATKEWGMGGLVNPVSQIRRPPNPKARERRFLPDEEKVIRTACMKYGGDLPHIVGLAIETGMRREEIAGMPWDLVDLKKRTVTLPKTKNGEKRIVPLSPEAVRILERISRRLDGRVWNITTPHAISVAWRRMLFRARNDYENECKKKKIDPDPQFLVGITFHDLRHEATSRFFEKGFNVMEVAAITGHKTLQMLKRYTHLRAEDLAERMKYKD